MIDIYKAVKRIFIKPRPPVVTSPDGSDTDSESEKLDIEKSESNEETQQKKNINSTKNDY